MNQGLFCSDKPKHGRGLNMIWFLRTKTNIDKKTKTLGCPTCLQVFVHFFSTQRASD